MEKKVALALGMLLAAGTAFGQSLELNLNDYSAQVRYEHPLQTDDYGVSFVNGRFLYNDEEETSLGSVGVDFVGAPGNVPGLKVGVGGHYYLGRTDHRQDISAVGVGLRTAYAPPELNGFGAEGRIAYAPKIFSFLDSERLLETALRLTYAVTPKIRLHVEYQRIGADFERHGRWTIDEGVRAGFQARF